MNKVKPLKQVHEGVRERETFKYDPLLLSTAKFNNSGGPIATSELSSSDDPILTTLAQLGVWRTGTDRSLISLFDSQHQYIVAEATPSQSLQPSVPSDSCRDQLWLCGTAIPRSHGVCDWTLLGHSSETEGFGNSRNDSSHLPLTLSQDLTTDARFSSKPYCQPGGFARFYAAVPIRTPRGINIGVYCVINSTPGKVWTDDDTDRMREISENIMLHLELRRSTDLCRRNERMNRGLGSFIEGKSTMSGWKFGPNPSAFMDRPDLEGALNRKQQYLQCNDDETSKSTTIEPEPCPHQHRGAIGNVSINSFSLEDMEPGLNEETPTGIFSKAANIIRESIEVEGCLFFDATMGSYRWPSMGHRADERSNRSSSTSSSDESMGSDKPSSACCQLLGFSTSDTSSVDGVASKLPGVSVSERFLVKLLRRHPKGQIFNFGVDGDLQPSDFSEDDRALSVASTGTDNPLSETSTLATPPAKRSRARQNVGGVILNAFPGARSVAFVPIWDPRKERWYAGGFIYTNNPARILTLKGELSYLRAFGTLAIADILRFNTLLSDRAKSDALGSLSHELRSPLHGALLSAELLMDTNLDVFQGNAVHTIETCSRTLLDTIDHLLDYAKINHFTGKNKVPKSSDKYQPPENGVNWKHFGRKSLICISRLDGLTEEVVESVLAGFNFQHFTAKRLSIRRPSLAKGDTCNNPPGLVDDEDPPQNIQDVLILLSFDPECNWTYNLPVGAFRRIIMNIFGNALKYTQLGKIEVSLTQDIISIKGKKNQHVVKFMVQDTGKGIGREYLKQKLFKPFSQEDDLMPGTGLGLSLVKQILSQLGGHISVDSQLGVGTTVSIILPLEQVSQPLEAAQKLSEDDKEFDERCRDLKGLRVQIIFPSSAQGGNSESHKAKLISICIDWLHMEVISDAQEELLKPDLVLWSFDALPKGFQEINRLTETPNLVICPNPMEAYSQSQAFESAGHVGVFEFLSQPAGPRKLAKTLLHAYKRWIGLPKSLSTRIINPPSVGPSNETSQLLSSYAMPYAGKGDLKQFAKVLRTETASSTENNDFSTPPPEKTETSGADTSDESPPNEMVASLGPETISPQAHQPPTPTKLLLVDDNNINLKVLSSYAKRLALQYTTATNGKEAFDYFVKSPREYKCIMMDISMPVMDGFEATRCIRAYEVKEGLGPVSIVALSGLASEDAQREAFGSGMDSFLTKPAKLKVLESLLKSQGLIN